jgi:hypothetical protein
MKGPILRDSSLIKFQFILKNQKKFGGVLQFFNYSKRYVYCRCCCRCRCRCFAVKPASLFPVNRPPSFSSFSTMLSKSAPTTAGSAARSARASQRLLAREIAHRATLKQLLCKKHNIGDVLAEAVIKLFESRGAYASLTKLHVVYNP